MVHEFLRPEWFMGYDMILQGLFALVTLLVAVYSFRSFKLTERRSLKLFGFGFLFISLAYFMLLISNVAGFFTLSRVGVSPAMRIMEYIQLNVIGLQLYILFFAAGLVTITYMTLNFKSDKLYALLLVPVLIALGISQNKLFLFHLICTFLMVYVVLHYYNCYKNNKQKKIFITFIAFLLLLIAKIDFIFSGNHFMFYVGGHIIEFLAYMLILFSFIRVFRK